VADSGGLLSRCTGLKPCTEGSNPSLSAIRVSARKAAPAAALVVVLPLCGCVERFLKIDSDPPGAHLYVNGVDRGVAPVEVPFTYYGTMRVDAWLDTATDRRPGVTQLVDLPTPWYEVFPLELFSELFDPVTHVDGHAVTIAIPPAQAAEASAAREADLRKRAEELRAETR
jgi:PEGA domain-containing protein